MSEAVGCTWAVGEQGPAGWPLLALRLDMDDLLSALEVAGPERCPPLHSNNLLAAEDVLGVGIRRLSLSLVRRMGLRDPR